MAFDPYDPTTDRGTVRLLIGDTNEAPGKHLFEDAEIDRFLALEGSDVRLASALALETTASTEALVTKKIRLMDLQTDGPAVSDALLKRAKELRSQADEEGGDFDYAEWVLDDATFSERLRNQALRET